MCRPFSNQLTTTHKNLLQEGVVQSHTMSQCGRRCSNLVFTGPYLVYVISHRQGEFMDTELGKYVPTYTLSPDVDILKCLNHQCKLDP